MAKLIPVFRVFHREKTIEFYVDYLGCSIEWEHAPGNSPFYMRMNLGGVEFDLSEHHGECAPGGRFSIVDFNNLEGYHRELSEKGYKFLHPGLESVDWDPSTLEMTVIDPFYNRIIFNEKRS